MEKRLLGCNASRTYFTQALLPGAAVPVSSELVGGGGERKETDKQQPPTYAYQMVRTDSRERKLDAFFMPKSLKEQQLPQSVGLTKGALSSGEEKEQKGEESMEVEEGSSLIASVSGKKRSALSLDQPFKRKARRKEVKLTSVKSLQQSVRNRMHKGEMAVVATPLPLCLEADCCYHDNTDLMELFQNHSFVGCVDQTRALVQHQTKLYLINVSRVT